jgi:gas vesicle protein
MGKGFAVGSFIFGGLLGAGLALLYAPHTGTENRAVVADKVNALWGESKEAVSHGRTYVANGVAHVRENGIKGDELREKIENARSVIAEQVAKNAAAAREAVGNKIPVAAERISQAATTVKGQISNAASNVANKVHGNAATEAAPAAEATAQPAAQAAPAAAAATATPAAGATKDPYDHL